MNPTPEQKLAIEEEGKNIIVSAGAGSGKTAVLSERVLRKVLHGTPVDRLLILTFTNAAAHEMKKRIRDKIREKKLFDQLNKIDSSYITTFDSFSLSLVKKYHYLLGVRQNVNIIESNNLNIKTREFLDMIMEEKYQDRKDNFTKLINDFCTKDDLEIKKLILKINDKLNMKYDKEKYLSNYINYFYSEEVINNTFKEYVDLIKKEIVEYNALLSKLADCVDIDVFSPIIDSSEALLNSNTYEEIKKGALEVIVPKLPKGSSDEAKKIKSSVSDKLKKIIKLTEDDKDYLIHNYLNTKIYVQEIIEIINKLDQKISLYKYENDLYDFVDISKMAIKIVKENKSIREEIKTFFLEIMVDEYQDTSDLQEELISLISNNNVYMVGDIKQSIYRFRNANPDIFRNKYNNYAKGNGGIKIDLLKNFRSRDEVLKNINLIFNPLMDNEYGGADYSSSHQMVFGNSSYNIEGLTNQNNNFEIYNYEYNKKGEFNEAEIEAFIIANDILEKVNNHYQVFDSKKNQLRDVRFDDFAILIDRSKSFDLYKKIFLYKQIPLSLYMDEELTNSAIFLVIKSIFKLLSLIKNNGSKKEIEYCYLSIARSFLFNYPDEEIFEVIKKNNYHETEIFKKVNTIILNIESKSISNILDEIIINFNVYEKLLTIPDYYDNLVKIDYLYTLSFTLNKMGYTYHDFISFIENIFDREDKIKFPLNKEDHGSVKIMTIHKSKGLEYNICYFPGLTKEFNDKELKDKFNYDNKLGIITPAFDEGLTNTFYQSLLKKNYSKEEVSEKIRLFYVALTRAKEKMIFILPFKEKEEEFANNLVLDSIRSSYKSFADILESIKSIIDPYIVNKDINALQITKDYNLINSYNLFKKMDNKKEKIAIINYPKIDKKELETSHFSKENMSLINKEKQKTMDFGTKIHYYLETLDLKNPDYSNIENNYVVKIKLFLDSPLLKNIDKANIYQEYEFIEEVDHTLKHGVIDLMIEYSDHIDIIDYKLKNINDDAYVLQLTGYKNYISKIKNVPVNTYLYSIMDNVYKQI